MKDRLFRTFRILKQIRIPWLWVLLSIVVMVVGTLAQVEALSLTGSIIDATQNAIRGQLLVNYIVSIVTYGCMSVARQYVNNRMQQTVNERTRDRLWDKLMRLPTRYYDDGPADELVSRITTDAASAGTVILVVNSCVTSVYSVAVVFRRLFRFHAGLASYALLVLPFSLLAGLLYSRLTYAAGFRGNASLAAGMSYLAERVRSFRLIKSTGMEDREEEQGRDHYRRMFRAEMLSGLAVSSYQIYLNVLNIVFIIIAFLAGGRLVAAGELSIGTLISFYSLSGGVTLQTLNLYSAIGSMSKTMGQLQRVAAILEAEEEPQGGRGLPCEARDMVLDGVSFGYRPEKAILRDVSFTIPAGQVTAVIGPNGAGKSTVSKLLTRMYEPLAGAVRYGEEDVRQFSLEQWRRRFAVVSQRDPLLLGTVRENILYGLDREVSEEELISAAKLANCYDFIMEKPGGFDAEVGLDGGNFSGGQQQCIAIARAMLRNAPCLLLDEATNSLDVKCEQMVTAALDRLMEGKTAVIIAHHSAAIRKASRIVVMKDGQVEAWGTPEELSRTNEFYRLFSMGELDERPPQQVGISCGPGPA